MNGDLAAQAPAARGRLIDPIKTRRLLLAAGLAVLALVAAVMYARRVDGVEVAATLLFMPIFVAAVLWRIPGGLAAGAAAAMAYGALRYPAIQAVGADRFVGLIVARTVGYLIFGTLAGWSLRTVDTSLDKLELYDQIDDETRLYNARFLVQETGLEMSRSARYHTLFSVVVLDLDAAVLEPLSRRKRKGALRDVGRLLEDAVRTVDRAAHAFDGVRHRFAVVLPETDTGGAAILAARLHDGFTEFFRSRGAQLTPEQARVEALSFPGDDEELAELREAFAAIERAQYPEASDAA